MVNNNNAYNPMKAMDLMDSCPPILPCSSVMGQFYLRCFLRVQPISPAIPHNAYTDSLSMHTHSRKHSNPSFLNCKQPENGMSDTFLLSDYRLEERDESIRKETAKKSLMALFTLLAYSARINYFSF